jgi:hypothetical protein
VPVVVVPAVVVPAVVLLAAVGLAVSIGVPIDAAYIASNAPGSGHASRIAIRRQRRFRAA